jgi:hypothetical protein
MPETAAKPGGLYLILRGAFQDAGFESLRVHSLSQRALLSSVYNRPATVCSCSLYATRTMQPFITLTVTCCPVSKPAARSHLPEE